MTKGCVLFINVGASDFFFVMTRAVALFIYANNLINQAGMQDISNVITQDHIIIMRKIYV